MGIMVQSLFSGGLHKIPFRTLSWPTRQNRLVQITGKAFHTSPRHHFLDECLSGTHSLIVGLHTTTGLPWAAVLPLTALLLRFMLIAPVTTYVHLTNRKRLEQQPLIQAWTRVYRDEVMKDHAAEGPIACQKLVRQRLIRKSTEIYRQTGTQRWKSFLGYLQIPIWLTVIETIRRMCGQQEGLLGMIRNIVYGSQKTSDLSKQRDTVSQSAVSGPTSKINGMQASSPEANGMLEDMVEAPLIPLDPTLATEGALWFPDLLVPDPHQLLSFILSGSLLANIYYQEHYSKKRGWEPSTLQRRVGNVFKIAALAIGPLTLSLQSAIHLYLISSSVFGLANTVLLKRFLPNPTTSEQRRPEMAGVVGEEKSREGKGGAQQIRRIRKRRDPNKHKA